MRTWLAFISLLFLVGCGESPAPAPKGEVYSVTGTIRKIKAEEKMVVIDHQEIPGYMEAMVMPFNVKDVKVLDGFKAGDAVKFEYHVQDTDSWIEELSKQ